MDLLPNARKDKTEWTVFKYKDTLKDPKGVIDDVSLVQVSNGEYNQGVYTTSDNKYVVKIETSNVFKNSKITQHGTKPQLKVNGGVRLHAFKTFNKGKHVISIMDHASYGKKGVTTFTAHNYFVHCSKSFDKPTNENIAKTFFEKLNKILHNFYKTVRGFHGDLHANNIMVIANANDVRNILDIRIIDYGNIVPLNVDVKTLNTFLTEGHENFLSQVKLDRSVKPDPAKVYANKSQRLVRSNKNMVNVLHKSYPLEPATKGTKRKASPRTTPRTKKASPPRTACSCTQTKTPPSMFKRFKRVLGF